MGHTTLQSPKRSEGERNCWTGQRTVSSLWCLLLCLLGSGSREQSPHTRVQAGTHTLTPHPGPPYPGAALLHALLYTEPLKSWEKPTLVSGNRSYLPSMHPNTGTPQKEKSQPHGFPLTRANPGRAAPQKGPSVLHHGTVVARARDWLLITWSMFAAVTGASSVRSLLDGDFSTFVALLSHLHLSPLL